jgi:hypothetical protein
MNKNLIAPIVILLLAGATQISYGQFILRPYATGGYLLTSPTASDLEYVIVGGGNPDQYLTVNRGIFGGGLQLLYALPATRRSLRIGLDVGWQKLFSSKFDTHDADGVLIYEDYSEDKDDAAHVLAMVEYKFPGLPVFVQGGIGAYMVFWTWDYNFSGRYSTEYKTESGNATNLGAEAALGINLITLPHVRIPVLARLDYISRYGTTLAGNVMVGVTFTF